MRLNTYVQVPNGCGPLFFAVQVLRGATDGLLVHNETLTVMYNLQRLYCTVKNDTFFKVN